MSAPSFPTPRLPVLGWQTFRGPRDAALPTLLDHPRHVLTTSGRAAILLALECVGIGPDDVVLLPTYHCPTMVAPVKTLGATALFYPIDATGAPQLDWLTTQAPTRVKAMLATHYFGLPQPMEATRAWCDARGIALIEDCAHALFGRSGARAVGHWGDVAIASLTKFFPTPEGGVLALNRDGLRLPALTPASTIAQVKAASDILHMGASHDRLTGLNGLIRGVFALRGVMRRPGGEAPAPSLYGQLAAEQAGGPAFPGSSGAASPSAAAPSTGSPPAPVPEAATPAAAPHTDTDANMSLIDLPLSHRALTAASAWVARQVPRRRIVETRRRHYAAFVQAFADCPGMRALKPTLPPDCAPYVFPLWVQTPDPGYLEMRQLGVPVSRWDRLWPGVPALPSDHGRDWSHHVLQLACHQDLSDADVQQIVAQVRRLFSR